MRTQTLTLLLSDLCGYTERQARSSRADIARDLERLEGLVAPVFKAFGGEVVKTMGDAHLVAFESPTDAVLAAVQVIKRLEADAAGSSPPGAAMQVRIGIATGEVSRGEDGDVFGDAVNLAARLQTGAEPSAIWLAETTFLSMNKNEVQAFEVGARVFKGVPGEVKVYRVLDDCIRRARALHEEELSRRAAPRGRIDRTPRGLLGFVLLAIALAVALAFAMTRESTPPRERFESNPSDLRSADEWMDDLTSELYVASEGDLQRMYREGTIDEVVRRHSGALGDRLPFRRMRLVYGMSVAPLEPSLPPEVLESVDRFAPLREDPQFVALLERTVEYAAKEPALQAIYAEALERARER